MLVPPRAVLSALSVALFVAACGSSSSSSTSNTSDAGADVATASVPCGSPGACGGEGQCCTVTVPDGFGPEGFRCVSAAWASDPTCLPPPEPCASPLVGALTRADAAPVSATCFRPLGVVGIAAASVAVDPGGVLELYFDRAPAAGDVVAVYAYKDRPAHPLDAGASDSGAAANAVAMRIGRPGGLSGFAVEAESASGSVTIASIQVDAKGISALHLSLDAELTGVAPASPWSGKLTGSW